MSFIYLASPYSHPDPEIMYHRFMSAAEYTAEMMEMGEVIYSPIVHCHQLAIDFDLPKHHEFWLQHNFAMLRVAAELRILCLPGWEDSRGVAEEIGLAEKCFIPITQAYV